MEDVDVLFEGDTVRLTFGGPLMSVLAVREDRCCCFWFDDQGRLAHGDFERAVIRLVQPAVRLFPHADPYWRKSRRNPGPRMHADRAVTRSAAATQSATR